MQAMILEKPGAVETWPLQARTVADPEPGPFEVRIRVAACGVCHTDLHEVEGEIELPRLPIIPGHQVVGRVDKAGEQVTRYRPGDRVGVPWLAGSCQQCRFCREGRENLCLSARFTGLDVDGGYAELAVAHQDYAFPIPARYADAEAAPLLCAGIIGFRALSLAGPRPGGSLGLYGFGSSAHLALQVARHWGWRVFVFSRSAEHRALAADMGAEWTGEPAETPPELLESAVIFAPAGTVVPMALAALDRGGVCVCAGIYMTPVPQMDYPTLLWQERVLRSVANATREDAREFLRLAGEIGLRTEFQVFPLGEANEVLAKLKASRIRAAAVLTATTD